jgi:hypothetical protein
MRFMLLMHGGRADSRHIAVMLRTSGELVSAAVLADGVSIVRARAGGPPLVTPSLAPPEVLAGYWVVDCDTAARAVEIAASVSSAADNHPVEIRPVLVGPGEEM